MDEETKSAIQSVLASLAVKYECSESYATVYYDAWLNDNAEDPILSLIYTAIKNNQAYINPTNRKVFQKLL